MREHDVIRYLAGLDDQQLGKVIGQARSVGNSRSVRDSIAEKLAQFPEMMGGAPLPLVTEPLFTAPKDNPEQHADG